ncbi:unnamed protein product [Schistosoma rodhaini]|uniref:Thioredoxin domain-containing protein n=1 Tax=Schistosoma rodhaini TaxID=6188 RepID=A0AA85FEY7_9TREM|nr:unnamed protein product [Schistosoma rodhaini]
MINFPSIRLLKCTVGSVFCSVPFSRLLSNATTYPEYGIINIQDDSDFHKRVLNNPAPVIVDFHAKWCGPCKILGPRLENIMKSYMNSVLLAKVDIDQLDSVAEKYKIKVVPTVISIKNGKEIERFEGNKEEEFIRRRIENVLAHNG